MRLIRIYTIVIITIIIIKSWKKPWKGLFFVLYTVASEQGINFDN